MGNNHPKPLAVGDPLPDLALPNQLGERVSLRRHVGTASLVLFFYPKDGSPICTRQACSFGDRYEEFRGLEAEVIGISDDTPESHGAFAARHGLPFTLLSDTDGQARRRFGTGSTVGLVPGRVTYVVDKQGIVRHIYRSPFRARQHVEEALSALKSEAQDDTSAG